MLGQPIACRPQVPRTAQQADHALEEKGESRKISGSRRVTSMLKATQQQLDLFLRYPTRQVVGVVSTAADLNNILQALADAGIGREAIKVFSGEEGIRTIDPKGIYHGLIGRLTRVAQTLGEELEHMVRYEEELRAGHFLVVVSTPDERSKETAYRAFRDHGGRFVDYYGPLAIEHLVA
jgi:hypothetical protein